MSLFVIPSVARNLSEPREGSRSLRRNNRAFGSLHYLANQVSLVHESSIDREFEAEVESAVSPCVPSGPLRDLRFVDDSDLHAVALGPEAGPAELSVNSSHGG